LLTTNELSAAEPQPNDLGNSDAPHAVRGWYAALRWRYRAEGALWF